MVQTPSVNICEKSLFGLYVLSSSDGTNIWVNVQNNVVSMEKRPIYKTYTNKKYKRPPMY